MTNEQAPRGGGMLVRGTGQEASALKGERLARRVPRFAVFVEAPEGGDGTLTKAQREFLDEFSSGLVEAVSERPGVAQVP